MKMIGKWDKIQFIGRRHKLKRVHSEKKGSKQMYVVHFYEKSNLLVTKGLDFLPSVDEVIKVKGRKGKVLEVAHMPENKVHVYLELEKIIKKSLIIDDKKSRRR